MKYVVYMRVSTNKQDLGLDAQKKLCREWIKKQDVKGHIEEWTEKVTGTNKKDEEEPLINRACLMDAISSLEPGDIFLVASRCRLARDIYLIAMIERQIEKKNAKLRAVKSDNGDSPDAKLMRGIIDLFAQYEAMMISVRTKAALQRKIAKGERTGTIPYGKQLGISGKLITDPYELQVLNRIKQLLEQGCSTRRVAEILNNEGYTKRSGNKWDQPSIVRFSNKYIYTS